MVSVLVTFDTKYGNTQRAAEAIAEGLKSARDIKVTVLNIKKVDSKTIPTFDAFLVGGPAHFGGPTGTTKDFIKKLGKLELGGKRIAVFDTYITNPRGSDFEKAARKMEELIRKEAPSLTIVSPRLSVKVSGMKGPIADGELPKCQEFGKRIAAVLRK
jgi:flavodoxin